MSHATPHYVAEEDEMDCPACDGQGYISSTDSAGLWQPFTCPDCGGAGVVEKPL